MKRILLFTLLCCVGIMHADAAVRDSDAISRGTAGIKSTDTPQVVSRTTTTRTTTPRKSANTASTSRTRGTSSVISRGTTARTSVPSKTTTSGRSGTTTVNASRISRTGTTIRPGAKTSVARAASTPRQSVISASSRTARAARATTVAPVSVTNTFGTEYNQCRDAYFTCMDQFCATMNDTYRRCVCSSRLTDVQDRERALGQTADQLVDFKNLNIDVIPKTAEEVNAMLNASEGELAIKIDTSEAAQKLAGISAVLSSSQSQALSTLGTLDIAGDINQIWATTNLASGSNIANLTGEPLYNAVHSQCVDLIADSCPTSSTLDMVISAYGMYIENDCSTLMNALDAQLVQTNKSIRDTEREMQVARLENYNAHNSTAINDCIAQVRTDITADTACGEDYVHCLDITGRYLNRDTGAPIYSPEFYQLGNMISLDGDVLTNPSNQLVINELNNKRIYAERGLETCRDIADEVWDEFVRQAVVEIYQGQQEKIRDVKNECLEVVNTCYDEESASLKDFSNIEEEVLIGSRLELSEQMCEEKLYACSNLYGDPNGEGLSLLIIAMHDITDQKIAKECRTLLETFAQETCRVASNDTLHAYPYGCRVYAPGDQMYADNPYCNRSNSGESSSTVSVMDTYPGYVCPTNRIYDRCKPGYYLATYNEETMKWEYNENPIAGNACRPCPDEDKDKCKCVGGREPYDCSADVLESLNADCGDDYVGSLYQKMVRYATQVCVRPSVSEEITNGTTSLPTEILGDVNDVMDSIRVNMATELSKECDRLGGTWVSAQWIPNEANQQQHAITKHVLYNYFYDETGANTKWGYCADKDSVQTATTGLSETTEP